MENEKWKMRNDKSSCSKIPHLSFSNNPPDRLRLHRHVQMPDAKRRQCVYDRANDCWCCSDRTSFANAFNSKWVHRRGSFGTRQLKLRYLGSTRHCVVHQRASNKLALFVVNYLFIHRLPERLHDSSMQLSVHQKRVNHLATVINRHIAEKLYVAGLTINLYDCDMRAERKSKILWLEKVGSGKTWFRIRRKFFRQVGRKRDVLNSETRLSICMRFWQCACRRFAYWNNRLGGSGSCSRSRSLERIVSTKKSD